MTKKPFNTRTRVFVGSTPLGARVGVINAPTQRERDRFIGRIGTITSTWTDVVSSGRCEVEFEAHGRKRPTSHWFDEHDLTRQEVNA